MNEPISARLFAASVAVLVLLASRAALSTQAAEPRIAVSVNARSQPDVFSGMPLLISGVFLTSAGADCQAPPVLLAAAQGPWTNAVTLEIRDAAGVLQSWPLHTLISPSNSIALDCRRYARIDWWLAPEETMLLPAGLYTVDLTLDTTGAQIPGAWKGALDAVPAVVNVLAEPAALTETEAENKFAQLASYELFLGDAPAALARVNQLLAVFPANIAGLRLKSRILESQGKLSEALELGSRAIEQFYSRKKTVQEPPAELFRWRRYLENSLRSALRLEATWINPQIRLTWSGPPDSGYHVESSSDLRQWSPLTVSVTRLDHAFTVTLTPGRDRQFFRLAW